MKTLMAEHAGFCFGVKRAVDGVYELLNSDKRISTYGPIIHNEEVVKDLEGKGVTVLNSESELKEFGEGCLIIRAHGIPKETYRVMDELGIKYVDLTCPFVKRIHNIVSEESQKGKNIVIVGSEGHPEVVGIKGWSESPVIVVSNVEEARKIDFPEGTDVCIVSQTTFNAKKFKDIVEIVETKGYNVNVVNTICNATSERQESAGLLAEQVDVMLVIGGRNSSNTQKLYEICSSICPETHFISTIEDLHFDIPETASLVGITAGASTPNNIIEEVQNYVRINF